MDEQEPHPSHEMSEWEETIVQITSVARFGAIRDCVNCGGEQAETVTGRHTHAELLRPCAWNSED